MHVCEREGVRESNVEPVEFTYILRIIVDLQLLVFE